MTGRKDSPTAAVGATTVAEAERQARAAEACRRVAEDARASGLSVTAIAWLAAAVIPAVALISHLINRYAHGA